MRWRIGASHIAAALLAGWSGLEMGRPALAIESCDGPTPVINACIWDRYEAADRELNAIWRSALARIAPQGAMTESDARAWRERLVAAQRAWATFKDEDCKGAVSYEWFGGTGATGAVGACLYRHTRARTDDLRRRYLQR